MSNDYGSASKFIVEVDYADIAIGRVLWPKLLINKFQRHSRLKFFSLFFQIDISRELLCYVSESDGLNSKEN